MDSGSYYGLGVLWLDYDLDGCLDLYVADDSSPSLLYHNDCKGGFAEVGAEAVARHETALLAAAMDNDPKHLTYATRVLRYCEDPDGTLAGARGTVVNLKVEGVALVDFSGLPPPAKGKVYQLWLITPGGHPDSAAVFVPDSNGGKVVLVGLPLTGYSQMAVTAEDGPSGSPAPSQQPELYGNLG